MVEMNGTRYYKPTDEEHAASQAKAKQSALTPSDSIAVTEDEAKRLQAMGHPEIKAGMTLQSNVHGALLGQIERADAKAAKAKTEADKPPLMRSERQDDGSIKMFAYHPQLGMWAELPGVVGHDAAKAQPKDDMTLTKAVTLKVKGTPEEKQFASQWIAEHRAATRDPDAAATREQGLDERAQARNEKQQEVLMQRHDKWQEQEQEQWNLKGAYDEAGATPASGVDTFVVDPRTGRSVALNESRRKEFRYLSKQAEAKALSLHAQAKNMRQRYNWGEFARQDGAQGAAPAQQPAAAAQPKQTLKASQISAWAKANGKDPAEALKRAKERGVLASN